MMDARIASFFFRTARSGRAGDLVRVGTLSVLALTMAMAVLGAAELPDGLLRLRMDNALQQQMAKQPESDLEVSFDVRKGVIEATGLGFSMFWNDEGQRVKAYNYMKHDATVVSGGIAADGSVAIEVQVAVAGDPWIPGGTCLYKLSGKLDGSIITGTYAGTFRRQGMAKPQPMQGALSGSIRPFVAEPVPGFVAPAPGEHPRFALRKRDLPMLRERLKTPQGQAILARMLATLGTNQGSNSRGPAWAAANLAALHTVTGEQMYADQALEQVKSIWQEPITSGKILRRAPRYLLVAIAYDLCYDAWDPQVRRNLTGWLENRMSELHRGGGQGYNAAPFSNWQAITKSGQAGIAMIVQGDPGLYDLPPDPIATAIPAPTPEPLPAGVVAQPFAPGAALASWLFAGPFPGVADIDHLAPVGGRATIRPLAGQSAGSGSDGPLTFAPLADTLVSARADGTVIDCVKALGTKPDSAGYFSTWVKVEQPQLVRLDIKHWRTSLWVGGQRVNKGESVRLAPGMHHILVQCVVGQPTGNLTLAFAASSEEDAAKVLADNRSRFQAELESYDKGLAAWTTAGSPVRSAPFHLKAGLSGVEDFLTMGLGDRGYGIEGDGYLLFPLTVALGHVLHGVHNAAGLSYTAKTGAGWILPMHMSQVLGVDNVIQHGPPGWGVYGGQEERSGPFATLMGQTQPHLLPALRWHVDHYFSAQGRGDWDVFHPLHGLYMLMNYPWDVPAKHPNEVMPKVMADTYHGHIIARNRYQDKDDCVGVIHLMQVVRGSIHKAKPLPHFQMRGLDKTWLDFAAPTTPHFTSKSTGKLLRHQSQPDGSLIASMDLSRCYEKPKSEKTAPAVKAGITVTRSLAFDYSTVCGAPALIALADRSPDPALKLIFAAGVPDGLRVSGNSFTVSAGKGTMTGVFVPMGEGGMGSGTITAVGDDNGEDDDEKPAVPAAGAVPVPAVEPAGALLANGNGGYLIVAVIHSGPAPTFTVVGSGPTAQVTVGGRIISMAGNDVVLSGK